MKRTIVEVKGWIISNIETIQTLEDISEHFEMSAQQLSREFRRTEGKGLWQFVRETRVEAMKHLLATTDLKCLAVCQAVGLRREDTGARLFRSIMNMTTDDYRRQIRSVPIGSARWGG